MLVVLLHLSVGGLDVDSVFFDVAATVVALEPVNSNSAVGNFRSDAGRCFGLGAGLSGDIKALRGRRLSAFVAGNKAEVVSDTILRAVEGEFEVVRENGSLNDITVGLVSVGELVVAHVVTVGDVFASLSVLPLDSDLVVTALRVGIKLFRRAKLNGAHGLNGRSAHFSGERSRPGSESALSRVASHSERVRSAGRGSVDRVLVSVVNGLNSLLTISFGNFELVRAVGAFVSGGFASVPSDGNLVVVFTESDGGIKLFRRGADLVASLMRPHTVGAGVLGADSEAVIHALDDVHVE